MDIFIKNGQHKSRDFPAYWFYWFIYQFLLKSKTVNYLMAIYLFTYISFSIAFWIEVLITFDSKLLIRYGPSTMFLFSGQLNIVLTFLMRKRLYIILHLYEELIWPVERFKNDKFFQKRFLYFKITLPILFIIFTIWGLILCPLFGQDDSFYYAPDFLKRINMDYEFLYLLFYFSITLAGLVLGAGGFTFLYHMISIWTLLYNVNFLLRNVSFVPGFEDKTSLIDDERYQAIIEERLKICVNEYTNFRKCYHKLSNLIRVPFMLNITFGIMSYVVNYFNILIGVGNISKFTILYGTCSLSCLCITVFNEGQIVCDEMNRLYDNLYNQNWDTFNVKNRRILAIFLTFGSESCLFGIKGLLEARRADLLKVGRLIYSSILFLFKVLSE